MTDEDAFLRAIYENPDDDAPRLVFADWLDEHGDEERAEFIRLQVALELAWERDERIDEETINRAYELRKAQEARLLATVEQPVEKRLDIQFERGFPEIVKFRETALLADFALLDLVPMVRQLSILECSLNYEIAKRIGQLECLDCLFIRTMGFATAWLELLAPLPPWTSIQVHPEDADADFPRAWRTFQQQRIAGLKHTTPARMRQTIRQQLNISTQFKGHQLPSRSMPITNGGHLSGAEDFELALLTSIPELEELRVDLVHETATGLQYLAQLRNLRSLEMRLDTATSITPLADCSRLERLRVESENGLLDDDGTVGLERLTSLRELRLRSTSLPRTATCQRLASLAELRILDMNFGELQEDSLQHLAGLRHLERLTLEGPTTDHDLRHLVGLTNLQFLALHGSSLTDLTLTRFGNLRALRTLDVRRGHGPVTSEGASQLAQRLPHVTIIHESGIYKSPQMEVTFRRRLVNGRCSMLAPVMWTDCRYRQEEYALWLDEDGWEHVDTRIEGGPARVGLTVHDHTSFGSAAESLFYFVNFDTHENPQVLEQGVVTLHGSDTASCIYRHGTSQELICEINGADYSVHLGCHTIPERFAEFRRLFCFIAESLRVGEDALRDVGEIVTVPTDQL